MINLLPPDIKKGYRYAHTNVRLVRWVIISGVALVGLAVISAGGMLYMEHLTDNYRNQVATAEQQLREQDQPAVQKKVTEISNNLKLVVQVLSREILFSKLLVRMGSVMPPNTILDNLSITQTTGAITITARATDYNAASQVQANMADPQNNIFGKADLISINCTTANDGAQSKYPCIVAIRALFADNNPYLFINSGVKP